MATKLDKTKLVRNLALKHKLVPHIERYLESDKGDSAWEFKYEPKDVSDDAWHPSGDCTPSLRELYLKAVHSEREKIGSSLRKTFMVGHFWHQYLQEICLRMDFCSESEVERRGIKAWAYHDPNPPFRETAPKPYHWVTGSADIAPCKIPKHGDYLIDFKTMNALDFRRNEAPAWTVQKWECQLNVYMDFFNIERALVVGIMKDSPHDLKEFEFHRNQPLIDRLYDKWKLVADCIEGDIEPPEDEHFELPLQGPVK